MTVQVEIWFLGPWFVTDLNKKNYKDIVWCSMCEFHMLANCGQNNNVNVTL